MFDFIVPFVGLQRQLQNSIIIIFVNSCSFPQIFGMYKVLDAVILVFRGLRIEFYD